MQSEENHNNTSGSSSDFVINLDLLQKMSSIPAFSDTSSTLSEEDINLSLKKVELDLKKESLESARQDREQRRKFAFRVFFLIAAYLAIVLVILFLCGFKVMNLGQSVIIVLLSTMTANVISIFILVIKYLFHTK